LGREDEHGYFWLTGRKRELIIRGGHNIEPRLIEGPLEAHPAIALVAAVGAPDSYLGEVPVAYVQLKPEHSVTAEELQSFAASVIHERAAVPQRIEIIESMPLTAVGKIFKPALIKKEIERTITEEASAVGIASISVELIDDRCRGVVARINAQKTQPEFVDRLGRYSFQVDWR
jgi:fatty-acyl-CoA synthase